MDAPFELELVRLICNIQINTKNTELKYTESTKEPPAVSNDDHDTERLAEWFKSAS